MRGLLRSGSAATGAQLVRILAIQVTHIVVRRWVPPSEMGVWNWLEPAFLILACCRDLGLTNHVLRLRPVPLGNVLAIEIGWGSALAGGLFVSAPWLALAMRGSGPELVLGLRVMLVYMLLEGISAVALAGYEAKLRIERTLSAELLRAFTYCAVVLVAAHSGHSFWSFVEAQIAAQAMYALELWRHGRKELDLHYEPGANARLVGHSLPLAGVWMLTAGVIYADSFIVGGLFGRTALGLYAFGYAYAFLVFRILREPIARSLYPAFVAFRADPREQWRAYRLGTVLFLAIEVPVAFFLSANARLVTELLGGKLFLGGAPYLALLAFAPLVDPLGRFGGELLIARHLDCARLLSLALQLVGLVVGGFVFCGWLGSPFGMAWANFLPLGAPVIFWVLWRAADRGEMRRLVRDLTEVYLVPVVPFGLAWWAAPDDVWWRLATTSVAALVTLGWTFLRHRREFKEFFSATES